MSALLFLAQIALALLPSLLLLVVLERLDAFRLVSLRALLMALGTGAGLAAAAFLANGAAMAAFGTDAATHAKLGAPLIEEGLKAAAIVYLFQRARIGFLIDAAILGFAIGAGFALAENAYYLYLYAEAAPGLWAVRGIGAAIMHAGASAIFAVLAQSWTERHTRFEPLAYVAAFAAAAGLHVLFNTLTEEPLVAAAAMAVLVPAGIFVVFAKSEHRLHDWLIKDHEDHERLLASMDSTFAASPAGRFIADVAARFEGTHTADIYAYMRLHAELVLRAEELLLAREAGQAAAAGAQDRRRFGELTALEAKIGRTAMLALWPHLHYSRRELAELYELKARAQTAGTK